MSDNNLPAKDPLQSETSPAVESQKKEEQEQKQQIDMAERINEDTQYRLSLQRFLDRYLDKPEIREHLKNVFANEIEPFLKQNQKFSSLLFREIGKLREHPQIQENIIRSLITPQTKIYHAEGPRMAHHLALMVATIGKLEKKQFDPAADPASRELIYSALFQTGPDGKERLDEKLISYIFLHDLAKPDCLTLKSVREEEDKKGKPKTITNKQKEIKWEEWIALESANPDQEKIIIPRDPEDKEDYPLTDVSYFQASGSVGGMHGPVGAGMLQKVNEIPEIVRTAIENHEIAVQFNSLQADKYREFFGKFSDQQQRFIIAGSYIDIVSSLRKTREGQVVNLTGLNNLIKARNNYLLLERFKKWCEQNQKEINRRSWDALYKEDKVLVPADLAKAIEKSYDLEKLAGRLGKDSNFSPQDINLILGNLDNMAAITSGLKQKMGILRGHLNATEIIGDISGFEK